jgi:hypothetical protein
MKLWKCFSKKEKHPKIPNGYDLVIISPMFSESKASSIRFTPKRISS